MKAITDQIRFKSEELDVIITISEIDSVWGFERTDGYSTWGCVDYKTFNDAYNAAKKIEKISVEDKRLEEKYYSEIS
ncbi:hypothetical protein KAR91_70660 [Candidatus Pacearchaeota archaeon]|nr:hypothetical protein [Candidatus Pacearchaeota archaeon]